MTHDEPTTRRPVDPTAVAIAGSMTLAWYAVPDLVRPRWARALLKTSIGSAGAVLTVTSTSEGRELQEAARSLRDAVADLDETPTAGATARDPEAELRGDVAREDNVYVPDVVRPPFPVPPALLALGAVGGVAAVVTLVVAGEKWAYRRGEALRSRGVRWPHTRVGLAMAGVAVAITAAEPFLWPDDGDAAEA